MFQTTGAYVDSHRERFLQELKAFIRIPSISTLPENEADVKLAAQFCADAMKTAGLGKH